MGNTELKVTLDTVFAVWFGGANYTGMGPGDLETFPNLEAAGEALLDRANIGYFKEQEFNYLHKPSENALTPTVDSTVTCMELYAGDPQEGADWIGTLAIGPDGAAFIERS